MGKWRKRGPHKKGIKHKSTRSKTTIAAKAHKKRIEREGGEGTLPVDTTYHPKVKSLGALPRAERSDGEPSAPDQAGSGASSAYHPDDSQRGDTAATAMAHAAQHC